MITPPKITPVHFKKCSKCGRMFSIANSNSKNPNLCNNCQPSKFGKILTYANIVLNGINTGLRAYNGGSSNEESNEDDEYDQDE